MWLRSAKASCAAESASTWSRRRGAERVEDLFDDGRRSHWLWHRTAVQRAGGAVVRRVDRRADDRYDVDVEVAPFGPQGLAQHDVEGLRCSVRAVVRGAGETGGRAHQHDAAAPLIDHARAEVMTHVQGTRAVDRDDGAQRVNPLVSHRSDVAAGAVVDDEADVELVRLSLENSEKFGRGEIQRHRTCLHPVLMRDVLGHTLQEVGTAGCQDHVESSCRQAVRVCRTEAFGRAQHHRPRSIALDEARLLIHGLNRRASVAQSGDA